MESRRGGEDGFRAQHIHHHHQLLGGMSSSALLSPALTTSLEDVVELTSAVRRNIRRSRTRQKDCLTLCRFLCKIECLVESLGECVGEPGGRGEVMDHRPGDGEQEEWCHLSCTPGSSGVGSPVLVGALQGEDERVTQSRASGGGMREYGRKVVLPYVRESVEEEEEEHATGLLRSLSSCQRPVADLDDIVDAVESVVEAFSSIQRQSFLERLLLMEDNQEVLRVAASDLGYSISTMEPLLPWMPDDVAEDYEVLQRQLKNLFFFVDPDKAEDACILTDHLALHVVGDVGDEEMLAIVSVTVMRVLQEEIGPDVVLRGGDEEEYLEGRFCLLDWLVSDVWKLWHAAMRQRTAGDHVSAFQYLLIAQSLIVWNRRIGTLEGIEDEFYGNHFGWGEDLMHVDISGCVIKTWETRPAEHEDPTMQSLLRAYRQIEDALHEFLSSIQVYCALGGRGVWDEDACRMARECIPEVGSEIEAQHLPGIYTLSLMIERHGPECPALMAQYGIPQALLFTLESVLSAPAARRTILLASRTLFRDSRCRSSIKDMQNVLHILLRYLTSPVPAVRRSASRALGNYCIGTESIRILAHRMGATQSLFSQIKRGDVLGQQVATAAIANLAANSEMVQAEMGQTKDLFEQLVGILQVHTEKRRKGSLIVLENTARVIQNLTNRVHVNRLKAKNAGAIPELEKLLMFPGSEPRTSAALALCNVTKCCPGESTVTDSAVMNLLDMLGDRVCSALGKTGALFALRHAFTANISSTRPIFSQIDISKKHIDGVVNMLRSNSMESRRAAAGVIATLCHTKSQRVRQLFISSGAIGPLQKMKEDQETKNAAISALNAVLSVDDTSKGGTIDAVEQLQRTNSASPISTAC